jgi:hypothetical protein
MSVCKHLVVKLVVSLALLLYHIYVDFDFDLKYKFCASNSAKTSFSPKIYKCISNGCITFKAYH